MSKIIITIAGGNACILENPTDCDIEIRSYDIPDDFDGTCETDKHDDRYQEMIFPATKNNQEPICAIKCFGCKKIMTNQDLDNGRCSCGRMIT